MSKTTTQPWNDDRLGFLTASEMQFERSFGENWSILYLLRCNINGEAQHLFIPTAAERTIPNGSIQMNVIVVGNAVDNLEHLFSVKTLRRILKHMLTVMEKGDIYEYY